MSSGAGDGSLDGWRIGATWLDGRGGFAACAAARCSDVGADRAGGDPRAGSSPCRWQPQPGPHSFAHAQALARRAAAGSLPLAAQAQVSGELAAGMTAYQAVRSGDGYRMANGARGMTAAFDRSGVAIAAGALSVGMSLQAIGSGSSSLPVGESSPAAHRNRVSYARGGVSEWYRNGPLGIEQGFTIARPPLGGRRGPLTLTVALTGRRARDAGWRRSERHVAARRNVAHLRCACRE